MLRHNFVLCRESGFLLKIVSSKHRNIYGTLLKCPFVLR